MGRVFKARQKVLNRVVALKVIRKECLDNPKVNRRFQREILAAGQLSHPHIVRAYDADQVNGTYYIAMEYIDGVDLAKLLKDGAPLPVEQACEYIRQAALGLQHAFERGMVHRDIKPANLLVSQAAASDRRRSSGLIPRPTNLPPANGAAPAKQESGVRSRSGMVPRIDAYPWGVVKILDMGLARYTDPNTGQTATHLTQLGSVMGTPEFIAPEQARDSHNSDIRADLYSLGCTLYFLLTGQPPFPNGNITEKLLQHQFEQPPPADKVRKARFMAWLESTQTTGVSEEMFDIPSQVDAVLCRLLAKRPEDRYQTPIELANELQGLVTQLAAGTLPKVPVKRAEPDSVIILLPDSEESAAAACASTKEMEPLVKVEPRRTYANPGAALIAIGLACLGGIAFLTMVTLIAVLMSRTSRTQAGVVEPPPAVKQKDADPAGKRNPK
jgi:serine/threonine-protein kinase